MPERSAAPLHLLAGRRLGRGDRAYPYSLLPRRGERDELHRQDRRGRQAAQQDAQMRDARPGKNERLRRDRHTEELPQEESLEQVLPQMRPCVWLNKCIVYIAHAYKITIN